MQRRLAEQVRLTRRRTFQWMRQRWPRATMQLAAMVFTRLIPFEPELRVLRHLLRDAEGVAVDVGANAGLYSAFLARYYPRVIAVEPAPAEARLLERWLPPQVTVAAVALSDVVGTELLWTPVTTDGLVLSPLASLDRHRSRLPCGEGRLMSTAVPVTTLDRLVGAEAGPIGLIKIDVEGHEFEVLEGGRHTVTTYRPILVMEHSRATGGSVAAVPALLHEWGYILCRAHRGRLHVIRDVSALNALVRPGHETNLVALHEIGHSDVIRALWLQAG